MIFLYGLIENTIDQCIYLKFIHSKFVILVLYIDDILLASNDVGLLHDIKKFLLCHFEMKDFGNVSYILDIQIDRDHSRCILSLSKKTYIDKVLEMFNK